MALTDLGTKSIAIQDGFVPFDSFSYRPGNYYLGFIEFNSTNPEFIYSTFNLRIGYPVEDAVTATTSELVTLYYSNRPQFFGVGLPRGIVRNLQLTLEVNRRPFWRSPTKLADTTVNLKINLDSEISDPYLTF